MFDWQTWARQLWLEMRSWASERSWLWRLPLLLFVVFLWFRHFSDLTYDSVVSALNLGLHEAGHLVFSFGGEALHALGGTLLQLAGPLAGFIMFWRQRDFFALAVALAWFGTNFYNIGRYMIDAHQPLGLIYFTVGSGEAFHDWDFLFTRWGMMDWAETLGWLTCRLGDLCFLSSLLLGGLLLAWMFGSHPSGLPGLKRAPPVPGKSAGGR